MHQKVTKTEREETIIRVNCSKTYDLIDEEQVEAHRKLDKVTTKFQTYRKEAFKMNGEIIFLDLGSPCTGDSSMLMQVF